MIEQKLISWWVAFIINSKTTSMWYVDAVGHMLKRFLNENLLTIDNQYINLINIYLNTD